MNQKNIESLLTRYYQGETSKEEEMLLKNHSDLSEEEAVIFEAMAEEKADKMDWDFESWMNRVESDEKKIIPIKTSNSSQNVGLKYAVAAGLVFLIGIGALFFNQNTSVKEKPLVSKVNTPIVTEPTLKEFSDHEKTLQENFVTPSKNIRPKNQILSKAFKSNKTKKIIRPLKIQEQAIERYGIEEEMVQDQIVYDPNFVMINGKKVENEEAAVTITQNAFQIFASNVSSSVQQGEIMNQIQLEF